MIIRFLQDVTSLVSYARMKRPDPASSYITKTHLSMFTRLLYVSVRSLCKHILMIVISERRTPVCCLRGSRIIINETCRLIYEQRRLCHSSVQSFALLRQWRTELKSAGSTYCHAHYAGRSKMPQRVSSSRIVVLVAVRPHSP